MKKYITIPHPLDTDTSTTFVIRSLMLDDVLTVRIIDTPETITVEDAPGKNYEDKAPWVCPMTLLTINKRDCAVPRDNDSHLSFLDRVESGGNLTYLIRHPEIKYTALINALGQLCFECEM